MTPHAGAEWRAWPGTAGSHHVPPHMPLTLKQCPETLWTQSPVCGPGPDGGRPSPGTLCMFSELQPSETCLAPVKNHEQIASGETAHKHCFLQNTGNTHGGINPQGSKTCVQCQGAQGSPLCRSSHLCSQIPQWPLGNRLGPREASFHTCWEEVFTAGAGLAWQPHGLCGRQAVAFWVDTMPRLCRVGEELG